MLNKIVLFIVKRELRQLTKECEAIVMESMRVSELDRDTKKQVQRNASEIYLSNLGNTLLKDTTFSRGYVLSIHLKKV